MKQKLILILFSFVFCHAYSENQAMYMEKLSVQDGLFSNRIFKTNG